MNIKYNVRLKDDIEQFTKRIYYYLFDEKSGDLEFLREKFLVMATTLSIPDGLQFWKKFELSIPEIRLQLHLDAKAFEDNDPANKCHEEIYLAYPGFYAIAIHRLSHKLLNIGVRIIPRMMSEYVHGITGIDIHPGATIGASFFLDHGTGIVIGETTIINNEVKIYQGVTLGGVHVKKNLANIKRHPTIEDNVVIYANATVLGGDVVIGANSIIGANVCVTNSVPPNSVLTYKKEYNIRTKQNE
ncbi:serine O-acetyltransferase EpsC [Psychroserpens sp. BH13MA-6]